MLHSRAFLRPAMEWGTDVDQIYVDQGGGKGSASINLELLTKRELPSYLGQCDETERAWIESHQLGEEGLRWVSVPGTNGGLDRRVAALDGEDPLWAAAGLAQSLPQACYRISRWPGTLSEHLTALGWGLGAYQFTRYKNASREPATLRIPDGVDGEQLRRELAAMFQVRDLINTPTEDMGPDHLTEHAREMAKEYGAEFAQISGDELLQQNFPAIHAVGRASHRAPRLIELNWGGSSHPKVTLVGKGVCFDTGGLDLKSAVGMQLMKKDMGGAAHVLGLAALIMGSRLPVRLKVLVPAVENAVGPNAYRPGDIIPTRAGLSVEVGNTDAEGRVILCDALAYACESNPDVLIDFATLTGAARVALGTDLPALFCNRDELASGLLKSGESVGDLMWRMPLHQPYRKLIEPNHANLNNSGVGRFGGAITAALFLESFVDAKVPWCHVDTYGWNDRVRPGRPVGGEALGMRATFDYLRRTYGGA